MLYFSSSQNGNQKFGEKKRKTKKYHVANYKVQVCSANYILFYSLVNTIKKDGKM